jgi:hypothetical protein
MVKMDNVIIQLKQFFRDHGIHVQVAENINDNSNFAKLVIDYSHKISADMVIILSDMKTHHVVLGGKEEDFFFNTYQIPVLCLPARNYKSSKFSVSGA